MTPDPDGGTQDAREFAAVHVGRTALVAVFVTAIVTAQLTAAKVLQLSLPVSLPVVGDALLVPGGVFAYALTFFATDCYAELYGRREARALVNVGFVMNLVMLGLVWVAIRAPAAPPGATIDPGMFRAVLGASTSVVAGSLLAYAVSQNYDVWAFHRIREYTDGDRLWLRNVGSTGTSQLVDTAIFVTVAFTVAPTLLRGSPIVPLSGLAPLLVGQYLVKLGLALGDTPFVYAVVGYLRETEFVGRPATAD
jgi:uncharacterized integral membrane protein (TIGR00697 family)